MKSLLSLIILATFAISCQNTENKPAVKAAVQASAMKSIEISVKGMTCEGCENTVKESVSKVAGVAECTASFKDNKAVVKFDTTKTNYAALSAAITEAGYEVSGEKPIR